MKLASAAVIAGGVLLGSGVIAAPAHAASPAFRIYYSPNCSGSSRWYGGYSAGEAWERDTFTYAGAGQGWTIRKNAASVSVSDAVALISADGGYSWARYGGRKGPTCYNLGTQRNRNTNWIVRAA